MSQKVFKRQWLFFKLIKIRNILQKILAFPYIKVQKFKAALALKKELVSPDAEADELAVVLKRWEALTLRGPSLFF